MAFLQGQVGIAQEALEGGVSFLSFEEEDGEFWFFMTRKSEDGKGGDHGAPELWNGMALVCIICGVSAASVARVRGAMCGFAGERV